MILNLDTRRHAELFEPHTFTDGVTVIGAGATGSWLVMQLAKLGITEITVYDFDVVEEHNIPNQLFGLSDVGKPKVLALFEHVFNATGTEIIMKNEKFVDQRLDGYVFLMVDTMSGRKEIFNASIKMKTSVKLLVEPRMGLDEGRIYTVEPMNLKQIKKYEACWYPDEVAPVSACGTSMSVITSALVVSAWCARQLINAHAGVENSNEILIDMKYNSLIEYRWGVNA